MFSQRYRLKTKDVLFLTKKRQYFGSGLFGFFFIVQYPNIPYNQASFHVSIKWSKHSCVRNIFKRSVISWLQQNNFSSIVFGGKHYKLFLILNKNKLEELQKQVANKDKKDTIAYIQGHFAQSFTALQRFLGNFSKTSFNEGKTSGKVENI